MNIIIKLLAVFFVVYSSAYANCAWHKTSLLTMKEQVDEIFMKEKRKSLECVYEKLLRIVQNNIDFKGICRFVMGKHWKLASQKEKEDFLKEYEVYLTRLCVKILYKHINNSEMIVTSIKAVENETCLIGTRLSYGNEEFTNVDFLITKIDSSYLINDIVVSGISIAINQRSEFSEKIYMNGITSVVDELKRNNNLI